MKFSEADLRDPMDSDEVFVDFDGPFDDEDCYSCLPAPRTHDEGSDPFPKHFHMRIWGRRPDASPQCFKVKAASGPVVHGLLGQEVE